MPGPLGAIVSHGYDQLEALEKMMAATGDSTIKQVVSDWKVANSVFTAADVAFSTQRNRVAVKGSLDIPNKKFNSVTIAVVDPDGCIVNSETVNGSFENPEVKDVGIIQRTLIIPLKKWLNPECQFFYNGKVLHPSGQ
jgi:AsmA protein